MAEQMLISTPQLTIKQAYMKINLSSPVPLGKKSAAFSLIEVVFGMAIIGTVVGAMVSGITNGTFTMRMARENLRATQILLEKVETIRLYDWDQINTANFIPTLFTNSYDPQVAAADRGLNYTGAVAISSCPVTSTYSTDMRMVTVSLGWQTGGLQRNRQFVTYISRNGLQEYIY
jgi:type II secretory pathway pseudopilin PulG